MREMKDTLRYKNMVANLKNRPAYVKEAALLKEIAGGRQWRMDAVIEAISAREGDWADINTRRVLEQAAMFGRLATVETICRTLEMERSGMPAFAVPPAFHMAVLHGHTRVADYLADKCGARPDSVYDMTQMHAMSHVIAAGEFRKAAYLFSRGARVADETLQDAIFDGNIELAELLVTKGGLSIHGPKGGEEPFLLALVSKNPRAAFGFCLKHGADAEKALETLQGDPDLFPDFDRATMERRLNNFVNALRAQKGGTKPPQP